MGCPRQLSSKMLSAVFLEQASSRKLSLTSDSDNELEYEGGPAAGMFLPDVSRLK